MPCRVTTWSLWSTNWACESCRVTTWPSGKGVRLTHKWIPTDARTKDGQKNPTQCEFLWRQPFLLFSALCVFTALLILNTVNFLSTAAWKTHTFPTNLPFGPQHDKTNKMSVRPAKTDQPEHPPSLIRVFAVRMKKPWVLIYPLSAQRRLWSDWADAKADLSLRWAHSHFVGFVISRLMYPKRWQRALRTAQLE